MFLTLVVATFISEDLACVAAGLMIQQGLIEPMTGIGACALGIFAGDLGLYAAGRWAGAQAMEWRVVRRFLTPDRRAAFSAWFDHNAATAILASRFLPGTRLPLYLACGALRASLGRFSTWTAIAVTIWTPLLVLASAQSSALTPYPFVAALVPVLLWRLGVQLASRRGRQRAIRAISRVWRWEFWPMWLFYAPVGLWIGWLTRRHRGLGVLAAANPGMPDGGIVGESKHAILNRLPQEWTIPSLLVTGGDVAHRAQRLRYGLMQNGWRFPLILKPDVGQRGTGVKLIRTPPDAIAYLTREAGPVLVQPYHRGPFEAGVFYYRMPGAARGAIFSITDKHFPSIVGNGRDSLEDLIWAHPRLRMQAETFLKRHAAERGRILRDGEVLPLAVAGNHAQGTLFKDGRHLITPALEDRIDAIARSYRGFFIGRFDIRYSNVEDFKAGRDLAIVELNGATAESTNIYDPTRSLFAAYRQLFRQWSLVFAVGAANIARGEDAGSLMRLVSLVRDHLNAKPAFETSD